MVTIKIKENSKQAKAVIEMLKTFSFVEIQNTKVSESTITKAKPKSAIDISLDEEKKGKINFYKNSNDLFNKDLNV
jgi:hypothetical protein